MYLTANEVHLTEILHNIFLPSYILCVTEISNKRIRLMWFPDRCFLLSFLL